MRLLLKKIRALGCAYPALLLLTIFAVSAQAQTAPPPHNVLIKNATVMTVTHGNIQNGSIYIKDGKIAAVGATVNGPADALVIDAGGKYLTPGIVDCHSHIALDDDVNEAPIGCVSVCCASATLNHPTEGLRASIIKN